MQFSRPDSQNSGIGYNLDLSAMTLDRPPTRPSLLWSITLPPRTYLGFESLFSHEKRWMCGEFIKMKLRDLQSLLIVHRILWYFRWRERNHGWRSSCKTRHWNCASNLFFTFRDRSPCTPLHGDSTCSTLINRVKKSLIRCLWWFENCSWIAKNVSLCPRQIPYIRSQALVAAQHRSRTWNDCQLTGSVR